MIKTAGPASAGRRASPLPALKMMLAWVFHLSLNFIVLHGKFLFKVLLMGGVGWVGIAEATVEETIA